MEESHGFLILHRKILHSTVFDDPITLKVWIWCLARASYKKRTVIIETQAIEVLPGEFVTGRYSASKELKMGATQYRNRIKVLQKCGKIIVKSTNKFSKITVVNWDYYQRDFIKATNKRPSNDHQTTTNNKGNKGNKDISEFKNSHLSDKEKDMSWNNKAEDYEEGVIDLDGDGSLSEEKKKPTRKYPNAPAVRKIFQEVIGKNPANWKVNKNQLQACENLVEERGLDKIRNALTFAHEHRDEKFCPKINSPYDLDSKYQQLADYKLGL